MASSATANTFKQEQSSEAASFWKRFWQNVWLRRLIFYTLFLSLWQGVVLLEIWPSYALPGPLEVLEALVEGISNGSFIEGSLVSLQRLLIGYGISCMLGLFLGLLMGRFKVVEQTLGSLMLGVQALPSICWQPLAVLWFGLTEESMIFVVIMGALFSITLGVDNGIKNTPPIYVRAARTLGTRGLALATQVIFPAALPAIVAGLKQGWTFAWRSLMAAELLYFTRSLGNLLVAGRDVAGAKQTIAIMVLIIIIGSVIDILIFTNIERRIRERWGLQG
jgi:NitT/TauT family transport system permease protein